MVIRAGSAVRMLKGAVLEASPVSFPPVTILFDPPRSDENTVLQAFS